MSKKIDTPHIVLVNPWIHDFAAYDFWAKPYGLLSLAALLRDQGLRVSYLDCLDRFHPRASPSDGTARQGRGPYRKRPIAHPKGLERIERTYSRYGIEPSWFRDDLDQMDKPDLILVTSMMTYWYPGVFETIRILKEQCPKTPLVLGGIYARLCTDHARRHAGADEVTADRGESLFELLKRYTGYAPSPGFDPADWIAWPYPAYDLQHRITYVPLLTSRGCPLACSYCASAFLEPETIRRSPDRVIEEIAFWHQKYQVRDFAFYDDALLVDAEHHALPILEKIIQKGLPIRLHTPNAIHIRAVTSEAAGLMKAAGMQTLRLGLETTAFDRCSGLDRKVTQNEFAQAVGLLKAAGFHGRQLGAYLLVGLPGQDAQSVAASIQVVKAAGVTPVLAHYTPIPHTALWPAAVAASRYDLAADPIFSNNAVFPCQQEEFSWPALSRLKRMAAS
jgi:radical SAM superfamily enzyme YgiQ (UPF0313 family)